MDATGLPGLTGLAAVGIAAGLWLLVRGLGGYRTAARIGGTSTSTISSLAAGEVRISGVIETADVTLISPLQSEPCICYRASIRGDDDLAAVTTLPTVVLARLLGWRARECFVAEPGVEDRPDTTR